jgi:hypothetical protein
MDQPPSQEIRIMKPFEDGFMIMKAILFQPFDLTKWVVIGFAAFIAGHFSAGGFSPPLNFPGAQAHHRTAGSGADLHHYGPFFWAMIAGAFLVALIFIFVFLWIRARGIFVFTDCIVRNRAAIKEPWREYRREGNSLFLFLVAATLIVMVGIGGPMAIGFIFASVIHFSADDRVFVLIVLIVLGAFVFVIYMCVVIVLSITGYFMPMVMYRQRCLATEAFRTVVRLMWQDPGAFTLFALFGILLVIGFAITASMVTCATCCVAALPYVGTVVLLPAFIWLRSFGLLFFRQFGAEFDVWAGAPPIPLGPPPLPAAPLATT